MLPCRSANTALRKKAHSYACRSNFEEKRCLWWWFGCGIVAHSYAGIFSLQNFMGGSESPPWNRVRNAASLADQVFGLALSLALDLLELVLPFIAKSSLPPWNARIPATLILRALQHAQFEVPKLGLSKAPCLCFIKHAVSSILLLESMKKSHEIHAASNKTLV